METFQISRSAWLPFFRRFISLGCALGMAAMTTAPAATSDAVVPVQTFLPGVETPAPGPRGGHGFQVSASQDEVDLDFNDIAHEDDFVYIDLGSVNLKDYLPGGYVELTAEIDNPIAQFYFCTADPNNFWNTQNSLELRTKTLLQKGKQTYRIYLDNISPLFLNEPRHLFLQIANLGGATGPSLGQADIRISAVSLHPTVANWEDEKRAAYAAQYDWPRVDAIEPLYYEHEEKGVDWAPLASSPQLQPLSLNGGWKKKNFGEKTWDPAFLADEEYAQPAFDDANWDETVVPEPATPDQPTGYVWYRRSFTLPPALAGEYVLRLDDLADDGEIFLNGHRVGTQTSTENMFSWLTPKLRRGDENKSKGKSMLEYWEGQFTKFPGGQFPFDVSAVPTNAERIYIPMHFGNFPWPLAYRVTDLVKPGQNVVAVRTYGDPTTDFWILRGRQDRAAQHVFGILGNVTLASFRSPHIGTLQRTAPLEVAADGTAAHVFSCNVQDDPAGKVASIRFDCEGKTQTVPAPRNGEPAQAQFSLPAQFATYQVQASLLSADGTVLDRQQLSFHGTVIAVKDGQLLVNGDPFFIRGMNADPGVAFSTDWKLSNKEFLRRLDLYQRIGVNAIRVDFLEPGQFDEAFQHGIMVMPIFAIASTDWSINAFGQLSQPDYRLASDRQRRMTILLRDRQNILLWNSANELNHTPGYFDRPIIDQYLQAAYRAIRDNDPDRRPITYANVVEGRIGRDWNWVFYPGQDVVGLNTYILGPALTEDLGIYRAQTGGRPILFPEWGVPVKEKRKTQVDVWEKNIQDKWNVISHAKNVVGGFFYGDPSDVDGTRQEAFMRSLYQPYEITKNDNGVQFVNRDVAPMRNLTIQLEGSSDTLGKADVLAPGEGCSLTVPDGAAGTLDIRYETHHGLVHVFTQPL